MDQGGAGNNLKCEDCKKETDHFYCNFCGCLKKRMTCLDCYRWRNHNSPYSQYVCSDCINTDAGKRRFDDIHATLIMCRAPGKKSPTIPFYSDAEAILKIPSIQE